MSKNLREVWLLDEDLKVINRRPFRFKDLTEGDLFSLTEDGKPVKGPTGSTYFKALDEPYIENGVWSIETEYIIIKEMSNGDL